MNDAVIGLDAVTMVVSGKCPKQIEQRIEKRNKQGRLYLEVDKTKQNETYNVTIVLPSIIRPSNLKGFSLLDSVKLEYVIDVVKHDLQEILGTNNLEQLIVKKLEINANKSVPSNVNVDINVTYPLQDSYGNISEDIVIKATFNNETIKKINFDNFDYNNIPSIADEWWNHQALNY